MQVKFNPISAIVGKWGYKVNDSTFKIKLEKKGNKMKYTIKQLVEFAKNEEFEFMFATEEQLDKVIDIFNEQGLCGDDLFTVWNELNEGY